MRMVFPQVVSETRRQAVAVEISSRGVSLAGCTRRHSGSGWLCDWSRPNVHDAGQNGPDERDCGTGGMIFYAPVVWLDRHVPAFHWFLSIEEDWVRALGG